MLRSVVSKAGIAGQANDVVPERLQENTPPLSGSNLSVGASYNHKGGPSTTYPIGADMVANNWQLNDTVDGMGVITFADEVASRYFGLWYCLSFSSNSDVDRSDFEFRLLLSYQQRGERGRITQSVNCSGNQ